MNTLSYDGWQQHQRAALYHARQNPHDPNHLQRQALGMRIKRALLERLARIPRHRALTTPSRNPTGLPDAPPASGRAKPRRGAWIG